MRHRSYIRSNQEKQDDRAKKKHMPLLFWAALDAEVDAEGVGEEAIGGGSVVTVTVMTGTAGDDVGSCEKMDVTITVSEPIDDVGGALTA